MGDAGRLATFAYARRLDTDEVVDLRGDEVVPIASIFKILVALALHRDADRGLCDLSEPIEVRPADACPGGDGLNHFTGTAAITARDLLYLSIVYSDNTATDALMRSVGAGRLNQLARSLGLETLTVVGTCRELLTNAARDFGYADLAAAARADWAPSASAPDVTLGTTTRASMRDVARLLTMIWTDRAGPPSVCADVRHLLAQQRRSIRLRAAVTPSCAVASKTGTLPPWRGEAGVLMAPDRDPIVLAVMQRNSNRTVTDLAADLQIAEAARQVTLPLRRA